jgi:hypothetical protein
MTQKGSPSCQIVVGIQFAKKSGVYRGNSQGNFVVARYLGQ